MATTSADGAPRSRPEGITNITVEGFKSIADEQAIDVRPLTILAGANSSGKSSMIQPILLLKQTLEAPYDPGPLLLDGPHVRFTSSDQIFARRNRLVSGNSFSAGVDLGDDFGMSVQFERKAGKGLSIQSMEVRGRRLSGILRPGMSQEELEQVVTELESPQTLRYLQRLRDDTTLKGRWELVRNRAFLEVRLMISSPSRPEYAPLPLPSLFSSDTSFASPGSRFERFIREIVHVAGLRGNPARTYPVTALGSSLSVAGVGPSFPGPFETYTASILAQWQADRRFAELEGLNADLRRLGLTWKVSATPVSETQVELRVGRLTKPARGGARDLVNIADVGFGVSQVLPVLVALRVASRDQLVYLEQPELHLHPRAQYTLAAVLADAANRGVRVVVETHSSLLLQGVQALVAEGSLSPRVVKLHWFRRRDSGANAGTTEVVPADLDEAGAFGDWPEDFADVALMAESRYLDAAEQRAAASLG